LIIQLALLTSHQHILQCMPSTLSGAAHARSQRNDMAHNVAFYQLDARLPAIILIILLLLLQVSRKTACASRRLECRCRRHRHRVDGSRRRDISVVKYSKSYKGFCAAKRVSKEKERVACRQARPQHVRVHHSSGRNYSQLPAARTHTHPRTHSQNSAFWDFFQMGHQAKFLINALSNFCIIPRWYENIPDAATTTVCGIRELEREMWINKFFLQSAHRPLSPRVCAAAHLGACINAGALSHGVKDASRYLCSHMLC
jgi:hypothetical protein